MKNLLNKKNLKKSAYIAVVIVIIILLFNYLLMPWYVSGKEVIVPKVIGLTEEGAKLKLSNSDLDFVIAGERYDERYPKGLVIFQKPFTGAKVKEGRRIFLFISSGIPFVKIPLLTGKLFRDAQLTLKKMDLAIGDTTFVESDLPKFTVVEQQYFAGREVKKGSRVNLKISGGKIEGLIPVPDLLGKSLNQAEKIIIDNKLVLGRINYQPSFSLLPNTIIDQYPSKETFVKEGTSIDIFVTKDVETPEEIEEKK
jgi:serine/threonine-protein kinase